MRPSFVAVRPAAIPSAVKRRFGLRVVDPFYPFLDWNLRRVSAAGYEIAGGFHY